MWNFRERVPPRSALQNGESVAALVVVVSLAFRLHKHIPHDDLVVGVRAPVVVAAAAVAVSAFFPSMGWWHSPALSDDCFEDIAPKLGPKRQPMNRFAP